MKKKVIHLIQGPSGVGKSTLIDRLEQEGYSVIKDTIRERGLSQSNNLTGFELQMSIMGSHYSKLLQSIFKTEDEEIFLDINIEGALLIAQAMVELGGMDVIEYNYLKHMHLGMYESLVNDLKLNGIVLEINFHALSKPEEVIMNQIANRGTGEESSDLIMNYNARFYNSQNPDWYGVLLKPLLKISKKKESKGWFIFKYTPLDNQTDDWINISLKDLLELDI